MKKIARLVKGSSPTLLESDFGNQVIDRVNRTFKVSPPSAGRVEETETEVAIILKPGGASQEAYLKPLQLVDASEGGATKVRVVASTVMGLTPSAFSAGDDPPYVITVSGSGYVWAKIDRNTSSPGTGVSGVTISNGATVPSDTSTSYYVPIGSYSVSSGKVSVSNSRFGPIDGSFCRSWFTNPPEFFLNLS